MLRIQPASGDWSTFLIRELPSVFSVLLEDGSLVRLGAPEGDNPFLLVTERTFGQR